MGRLRDIHEQTPVTIRMGVLVGAVCAVLVGLELWQLNKLYEFGERVSRLEGAMAQAAIPGHPQPTLPSDLPPVALAASEPFGRRRNP